MQQASDPGFSASDCLFIYFNYTQGNKRHAEWPLTAMSNISFCQIWLFSLTAVTWCLYVRLRVHHYEKGGGELSEWPHRRGVLKVKKRAEARDGWTRRRERSVRGRGGTPAGSQASWLAVPILASDGFCQRGEKRVSSSLGHERIDVLSVGEG